MTTRDVIDRCLAEKMSGRFVDYDPLVLVLEVVAEIIGEKRLRENSKARRMWVRVVKDLQASGDLEHNQFVPCRYCDTAFEPEVGEELLDLFLVWLDRRDAKTLLAIHRCPACGGTLNALQSKKYDGDHFTPTPGTVKDDESWADALVTGPGMEEDES